MSAIPIAPALVFTDLDGTLLDHEDYSYEPARPLLQALEAARIPVIPVTSKTRAEIAALRDRLGNRHPFISENGAAVFVPRGYFAEQPEGTVERGDYWVYEISADRQRYLDLLARLESEYPGEFDYFARAGIDGIVEMTGLDPAAAALANQRDYSEPVQWLGEEERKAQFIRRLGTEGAVATQGGRFLSVCGRADKGSALVWLRAAYKSAWQVGHIADLAAGDSPNDCAMLEQAEVALLVRSAHHRYPALSRGDAAIIYSRHCGPEGWAEGVARWLERIDLPVNLDLETDDG